MRQDYRLTEDRARARLASSAAIYAYGIEPDEIEAPTRGTAQAALARQVAMYLAHVAFEMSLVRVAAAFCRDRSTVAHACRLIEDKRDDAAFDQYIDALEGLLQQVPPPIMLKSGQGASANKRLHQDRNRFR